MDSFDALRPITDSMTFIRASVDEVLDCLVEWTTAIDRSPTYERLTGGLLENYHWLAPLTRGGRPRVLLVGLDGGEWTAFLDCGAEGTDRSAASVVGRRLGARSLYVCCVDPGRTPEGWPTYGAYQFEVNDVADGMEVTRRAIWVMQDGSSRWTFGSMGEPFEFEDTTRYEAKRKRDRFGPEALEECMRGLGIQLRALDTYSGPTVLVSYQLKLYTPLIELSIEQARYSAGYPPVE